MFLYFFLRTVAMMSHQWCQGLYKLSKMVPLAADYMHQTFTKSILSGALVNPWAKQLHPHLDYIDLHLEWMLTESKDFLRL